MSTRSIFPTHAGGLAFFEYNYMDQDMNWSGASKAPAEANRDKGIRTDFFTAGCQYMIDRQWGLLLEVPYWNRTFTKIDDNDHRVSFTRAGLGDIRFRGIYSGLSEDMSIGVTFGLKLPTGDYDCSGFDRDTEIGTGSTDLLLGLYRMGALGSGWDWFANGQLDQPALTQEGYRPGSEVNAIAGVYYNRWRVGNGKIAPVLQGIASHHWRDGGSAADPDNTGYDRILLSPGVEFDLAGFSVYADVAVPVYQHVNGNQLVAPLTCTLRLSYSF